MSDGFNVSGLPSPLLEALKGKGLRASVVNDARGSDGGHRGGAPKPGRDLPVAWRLDSGEQNILFRQAEPGLLERFFEARPADFFDILSVVDEGGVELLLLTPSREGFVWLAGAARSGEGAWEGMLAERPRPESIDTSYTDVNTGEQKRYLDELFASFDAWLPEGFPLRRASPLPREPLAVRVDPAELWFLRFPVPVYASTPDYPLRQYQSVEYIVTTKTFAQYRRETEEIKAELRDVRALLAKTVIIINTYEHVTAVERAVRGTELLLEVLSLFRDVRIGRERFNLRWYLNPGRATLNSILSDESVAYLFANFESGTGRWEVGTGRRRSWDGGAEPEGGAGPDQFFELEGRAYDLSHVRLMRVYHCNSAYMHKLAYYDHRNPADEHSIVRRLLTAGACRVEGGLTLENYFDFLRSVIRLLLTPQLRHIMELQWWQRGGDVGELVSRLEEFNR